MKTGLMILPFLALLFGALGSLVGSAFGLNYAGPVGWGLAASLVILWVFLDLEGFKGFFARKGAKYGASSGLVVLLGVGLIVAVAVVTSRPRFNKSYDVTKDKLNTLSDQSAKVVETLNKKNEDIKVTAYFIDQQQETQFRDLMGLYLAKGAKIQAEYVDPQKNPTRAIAEKVTSGNTAIVRFGSRETRLTTFTEEKLTNALLSVLKEQSKKVYFTTGHGEGQLRGNEANGYDMIVQELENNKYDVAELALLEQAKVPEDANLLVIAGPKYDFKEEEMRFVEDYLQRGGALLAMVDATVPVEVLNKTLGKFGVKYNPDLLILRPDDPRAQLLGQNNAIVNQFDEFNPVTKDFARQSRVAILMPNSRSLAEVNDNPSGMKVTLVGKTADIGIKVKNVHAQSDLGRIGPDRIEPGSFPVIAVASGKTKAPATAKTDGAEDTKTDVATESGAGAQKEIRVVVAGSSVFATNQGSQVAENRDMFVNMTNYLLQDEDFISIRPKDPAKSTLSLTSSSSQMTLLFISFLYPFVILALGVMRWLKRRQA